MINTNIKNGISVNNSKRVQALQKEYTSQREIVLRWDELVQNEHRIIKNLMFSLYLPNGEFESPYSKEKNSHLFEKLENHRKLRDGYEKNYLAQMTNLNRIREEIEEKGGKVCMVD